MKLVALTGLAGSGKDTAAQALVEDGWVRVSFADPMREALFRLNPDIPYRGCVLQLQSVIKQYGWDAAKRECPPIRTLLQRFGTEVGRELWGEDFWVDQATKKVEEAWSAGNGVVISDVRFKNEAQWVHKKGGLLIRIRRPGVLQLGHASELGDFDVAHVIWNEGTVEQLHQAIREAAACTPA